MTVALVAVLCHVILNGNLPVCVEEVVPTQFSTQAGKVSEPVEMGFTFELCMSKAPEIAAEWARGHPIYRTWRVAGWKCVSGEYNSSHKA